MVANFKNDVTGNAKQVKVGFSWTVFFFGFFPPLFRGDFKWAIIMAATQVALAVFTYGVGSFAAGMIFSFMYNKFYVRELLNHGYKPMSESDISILNSKGYLN